MTRAFASRMSMILRDFASSTRYPTRTVEHAFAWVIIFWSYSVIAHTGMISSRAPGNAYGPMLGMMPAWAWGWSGMIIGVLRVVALVGNGHWRPSPEFRLLGAAWGMMFWVALWYCYWEAVNLGAADFPMRRAFLVFIAFEAYSCFRCGQDIGKRDIFEKSTSGPRSPVDAGYG